MTATLFVYFVFLCRTEKLYALDQFKTRLEIHVLFSTEIRKFMSELIRECIIHVITKFPQANQSLFVPALFFDTSLLGSKKPKRKQNMHELKL